jgi:uncharacterized LabA/DUF88 family protein
MISTMRTVVYIDASNLFYGGKKSLGWSIDYQKLMLYLKDKYQADQIYFFGGVEIHKFPFDYLANDTVSLKNLEQYLVDYIKKNKETLTDAKLVLLDHHLKQVHFYQKLEKFDYQLILKPVKIYEDEEGNQKRKANCDVEMAFYLMRDKDKFERVVILSGDGDFLPVLKHLRKNKKEVLVLARAPRTAKEIKQFAGDKFMDFTYLRERLKRDKKDL